MLFAHVGNVSSSNIGLPHVLIASVTQKTPMMFITIPDLTYKDESSNQHQPNISTVSYSKAYSYKKKKKYGQIKAQK